MARFDCGFFDSNTFLHSAYLILKQAFEEKKQAADSNSLAVSCNVTNENSDDKKFVSNISIK